MTSQVYEPKGYRVHLRAAPRSSTRASPTHLDDDTRLVWVETPSNPLLNVVDIRARRRRGARGRRARSSSTTRSPRRTCSSRSTLGADVVVHSTTKYLGGHSDVVGGFVGDERPDARRAARASCRTRSAPCPGRSTLARPARHQDARACACERHCENARARRRVPRRRTRRSSACSTPACDAPGPRARRAPDARLRRHGLVPRRARRRRRSRSSARTKLFALAESPRRRREPDRASRPG